MNKRIIICVALACLIVSNLLCSCIPQKQPKYKVLFAGSSDSGGITIPQDIDVRHYKKTNRDMDLWPDEMVIQFEKRLYDCTFDEVINANEKEGYQYNFKTTENNSLGFFVLDGNKNVVGYYYNKARLSDDEKVGRNQIDESQAIAAAEQVFRKYFNVDYSLYEPSAKIDESVPAISAYEISFKRKYDTHIEISDMLLVTVGLYGEIIHFDGLALGSIVPPEQKPDIDEIQQSIEERIIDLLKEQKISYSDLKINVDRMQLVYDKEEKKYRVISILTFDCKDNVDGVEKGVHDFIQVIVVFN